MTSWDPHGQAHLEAIHANLTKVGLIDVVRAAATEVWRINRERHEPEEAYDDAFTLGMLSYRNLANRLLAEVPNNARLADAGVVAAKESGSAVLYTPMADVRLVKVPSRSERHPRFESDFDWSDSEVRDAAALRNRAAYHAPWRDPRTEPMFEVPAPNAPEQVAACREVFFVWGAELATGLTAGWLGLPTTSDQRWIAVTPAWWDRPLAHGGSPSGAETGSGNGGADDSGFRGRPEPIPALALKPHWQERGHRQ